MRCVSVWRAVRALSTLAVMAAFPAVTKAAVTYSEAFSFGPFTTSSPSDTTYAVIGTGGQIAGSKFLDGKTRAFVWSPAAPAGIDLSPQTGNSVSYVYGTNGTQQVGVAYGSTPAHAILWNGTASSYTDLNPTGYTHSYANDTNGAQQVGMIGTASAEYAGLWTGTPDGVVNLNPGAGYSSSNALAIGGGQQVGFGSGTATGNNIHALVWSGTAASYVDLNPAGVTTSYACNTDGTHQVGYAVYGGLDHALLWSGRAASAVDLNPNAAGFVYSVAADVSGARQVGWGYGTVTNNKYHALLWSGTATSAVDLGAVLPSNFISSQAFLVTGSTVYGIAFDAGGTYHEIVWDVSNVPEPACLSLFAVAAMTLSAGRRVRTGNAATAAGGKRDVRT